MLVEKARTVKIRVDEARNEESQMKTMIYPMMTRDDR
jgi:hypothetical protein